MPKEHFENNWPLQTNRWKKSFKLLAFKELFLDNPPRIHSNRKVHKFFPFFLLTYQLFSRFANFRWREIIECFRIVYLSRAEPLEGPQIWEIVTFQDFFDQVWHQIAYASIGNKHFFTKKWPRQAYQNYEKACQRSQNSEFQSNF